MALQKQKVVLNLASGLDTKTDSKHLPLGKLTKLENAVYTKTGRLDKRNGFDALGNLDLNSNELTNPDGLALFNNERLLYRNQKLYSYSSAADRWTDKGACVSLIAKSKQVIKNTYQQTQVDSAVAGSIAVYAWEDGRGGVRATVIDEEEGVTLLSDVSVDSSATRVKCVSFQGFLFIFYYKSGSLYVRRVNPLLPTALDSAVTVSSTVDTSHILYDVINYNDQKMVWCHPTNGASTITAGFLDANPTVLSGTVTISASVENCLSIVQGPVQTFYFLYQNSTDGLKCVITNNGLTVLHAAFTVDSYVSTNFKNVTGFKTSTGVTVFYEQAAAATYNTLVKTNTITSAGSAGTASVFKRSVGLWSKAFSHTDQEGEEHWFMMLTHDSTLQATYFVIRSDGVIVARLSSSNASGLTTRALLATVSELTDNERYLIPIIKKNDLLSENATLFTPKGVYKTVLDFTSEDILTAKQLGNNLHIVGGALQIYDGISVVESGFHLYPENVSLGQSASGGSLSNGTYQVCFLYEWTDNFGQIHRSAPSVPTSISVSGGGSSQKITCTVPTLRLTAKDGTTRTAVSIVGYVTEDAGSVFYRFTSITSPTYNDVTADTVSVDCTAVTISNELLYTTGGVLENEAPPSCSAIEVYKNRVFLGGLEDEIGFWYSKEYKNNYAVSFSSEFKKICEPDGGDLVAFGILDDKILCLKQTRFYYSFGDGPNDLGEGGEFSEIQFVTEDIGCQVQSSVVRMPRGLMLKTYKGVYLIDAGFNTQYIGHPVEAYNDKSVTSGILVDTKNQVRFTTSDGPVLVYDYFRDQWSTFTGLSSYGAVMHDSGYTLLKTNGKVLVENESKYKDDKSSYGITIETGWVALDGIGGFQRVYKAFFLADYFSNHKLRVKFAYDYSPAYGGEFIFDPTTAFSVNNYGSDSPYGSGTPYGGESSAYRFSAHTEQQKCEAIRIKLEELISSSTEGSQKSLSISDISLLVGIKGGISRLKASSKIGADT